MENVMVLLRNNQVINALVLAVFIEIILIVCIEPISGFSNKNKAIVLFIAIIVLIMLAFFESKILKGTEKLYNEKIKSEEIIEPTAVPKPTQASDQQNDAEKLAPTKSPVPNTEQNTNLQVPTYESIHETIPEATSETTLEPVFEIPVEPTFEQAPESIPESTPIEPNFDKMLIIERITCSPSDSKIYGIIKIEDENKSYVTAWVEYEFIGTDYNNAMEVTNSNGTYTFSDNIFKDGIAKFTPVIYMQNGEEIRGNSIEFYVWGPLLYRINKVSDSTSVRIEIKISENLRAADYLFLEIWEKGTNDTLNYSIDVDGTNMKGETYIFEVDGLNPSTSYNYNIGYIDSDGKSYFDNYGSDPYYIKTK